jgi:hypothetical protein
MQKKQPHIINTALLWEYDLETFNYEKSYKIVIERVLERGNLAEWREMVSIYPEEKILECTIRKKGQRFFTLFFKIRVFTCCIKILLLLLLKLFC